jgi:predicted nucleotidyltransferase
MLAKLYFGSKIYGVNNDKSDNDIIIITSEPNNGKEIIEDNDDIHFYDVSNFNRLLIEHDVVAVESFFTTKGYIYSNDICLQFNVDLKKLRHSFSSVSNNSFVKAKKKFIVENERYKALKSLWHSIRILDFGHQLATTKAIYNFSSMNNLYFEIMNEDYTDWEQFKNKYKPIYNSFSTRFKEVTIK